MPTPQCKATSQGACMPGLGGAETTCVSKSKSLNTPMFIMSPDIYTEQRGTDMKALNSQNLQNWRARRELGDPLI